MASAGGEFVAGDRNETDQVLGHADAAMYAAKRWAEMLSCWGNLPWSPVQSAALARSQSRLSSRTTNWRGPARPRRIHTDPPPRRWWWIRLAFPLREISPACELRQAVEKATQSRPLRRSCAQNANCQRDSGRAGVHTD